MSLIDTLKVLLEDLVNLGAIPANPLELVSLDDVDYDLDKLQQSFQDRLSQLGYGDIQVTVINFDPDTGDLLVRFTNPDNDEEVDVLFTITEDGVLAIVVSQGDDPIEVNLTNLQPPLARYFLQAGIDWDKPLDWLTKSVVSALLEAGKLIESYYPIRGRRKERLPLARKIVPSKTAPLLKRIQMKKCNRKGKLRKKPL